MLKESKEGKKRKQRRQEVSSSNVSDADSSAIKLSFEKEYLKRIQKLFYL